MSHINRNQLFHQHSLRQQNLSVPSEADARRLFPMPDYRRDKCTNETEHWKRKPTWLDTFLELTQPIAYDIHKQDHDEEAERIVSAQRT